MTNPRSNADLQVTMKAKENAARRDKVPNLCYKALKGICFEFICSSSFLKIAKITSSAQCTRGDLCNFSHDIVPFPYCRSYNDTGVCNYTGCGFLHRLYDYIPPESKDEKNVYSIQANCIGESTRRMPTVESGRQGNHRL